MDWPQGDYFSQILLDFLAQGRARTGPVGACTAELLDGKAFVDFAVAWMERETPAEALAAATGAGPGRSAPKAAASEAASEAKD